MISMRFVGCNIEQNVPDVTGSPMVMLPYNASDFLRISTVCTPLARVPVEILVPTTLSVVFAMPSMVTTIALVPEIDLIGTLADVPVKVNDMPVAGQVNSLVDGFTRPRYRKKLPVFVLTGLHVAGTLLARVSRDGVAGGRASAEPLSRSARTAEKCIMSRIRPKST
jgi:hypothetical protein